VTRQPDHHIRSHDGTRNVGRQVTLPEVQDIRADGMGDIGAVVDREQRAMTSRRLGEHLRQSDLLACLETFLAELHDVDAARQRCIEELGDVTLVTPSVDTEV
jgi:hypothetical protein